MFGVDIFMVLGIAYPKAVNKKDISIKNKKKISYKRKGEKGEKKKREKGGKCCLFYALLNLCSAIACNVIIAC